MAVLDTPLNDGNSTTGIRKRVFFFHVSQAYNHWENHGITMGSAQVVEPIEATSLHMWDG